MQKRTDQVKIKGNRVDVRDGQFEKALRKFKKKVEDSGVLKDIRKHEFYEKPSQQKKAQRAAARKRWLKKINDENKLKNF